MIGENFTISGLVPKITAIFICEVCFVIMLTLNVAVLSGVLFCRFNRFEGSHSH